MGDPHTAPAEAYAPDPDRADPDSPPLMPEWLAYLIALVILFIIETFQALEQRHAHRLASRPVGRPAQPRNSAEPPAAAIGSQPGHVTTRSHRGHGVAPVCLDLSRTRAALLEKLRAANVEPSLWSQLEALGIVPGPIGPDTAATPTAPAVAPLCVARLRRAPRKFAPARPQHAVSPIPWRQIAHAGTGPPTGPPAVSRYQPSYA
ncbi:MAG TPA: hypothetical protein VGG99_16190 [Acetobacteraceae bacterium]|jgi:hypothetical protein